MHNVLTVSENRDPVCGMTVTKPDAPHTIYQANDYFFCCEGCKKKFDSDPELYLSDEPRPQVEHQEGMIYLCPMHPEVREEQPGDCPDCGMALEPETPVSVRSRYSCPMHPEVIQDDPGDCPKCGMALEPVLALPEEDDTELRSMTKRFWFSLLFSVPLLFIAMDEMIPFFSVDAILPANLNSIAQAILATPVVLWAAVPFFIRAYRSFVSGKLNMWSLIGLGTGVAYAYSLFALFFPHYLPQSIVGAHGAPVYFEAAAVIITLVLLGQVLELRARGRTADALKSLLALAPPVAFRLKENDEVEQILLDEVQVGDRLRVRPGEKVPVDGVLLSGHSAVDNSFITGESMPVSVDENDEVIGGAMNQTGSFVMVAQKVGTDTLLARMTSMVAEAGRSRAPIQSLADKVASVFVPIVLVSALTAFVVWMQVGPEPAMSYALVSMVSVLIIACPCALGLATPMSIVVGVGRGAQQGVLVRDARSMEKLAKVDTVVVDKTGTLTEGKPQVQEFFYLDAVDEFELGSLIYSLEILSEHPLAQSVVYWGKEKGFEASEVVAFNAHVGKGVSGQIKGHRILVGNKRFLREQGVSTDGLQAAADECRAKAQTVMFVSVDGSALGFIAVADPIKASSFEVVKLLQEKGIRIIVLTGDNRATAESVAAQLGLTEVVPEVLPQDKFRLVERLQEKGYCVAMVGDGINDAPALAQADVGIAMGTGSDVAMESGDLVLVSGDLTGLLRAQKLSKATMRNIKQNLFLAFFYNSLGVPVAAGVLYPFIGLLLNPMIASLAMSLSSVSVIGNALRLRTLDLSS